MASSSNNHHRYHDRETRLVAFDWDQTLWNSWDIHVLAAQKAAVQLDLEVPTEEHIAANFSVPFVKHMGILFPEKKQDATRLYMDYYHSQVGEYPYLFPGVPELLETLKEAGYMLALLSDKRQKYGKLELASTEIGQLFDYVLFLDRRRAYKPNPAGLQQLMEVLSVDADEVMYVGDSHVDIQCAQRSGAVSTAALWGCVNVEAVLQQEPTYVCHTVPEVLDTVQT